MEKNITDDSDGFSDGVRLVVIKAKTCSIDTPEVTEIGVVWQNVAADLDVIGQGAR